MLDTHSPVSMCVGKKVAIRFSKVPYLSGSQDALDSSSAFMKFEQAAVRSGFIHPTHKGLLIYSY